jgi:hypothetical protein
MKAIMKLRMNMNENEHITNLNVDMNVTNNLKRNVDQVEKPRSYCASGAK